MYKNGLLRDCSGFWGPLGECGKKMGVGGKLKLSRDSWERLYRAGELSKMRFVGLFPPSVALGIPIFHILHIQVVFWG